MVIYNWQLLVEKLKMIAFQLQWSYASGTLSFATRKRRIANYNSRLQREIGHSYIPRTVRILKMTIHKLGMRNLKQLCLLTRWDERCKRGI